MIVSTDSDVCIWNKNYLLSAKKKLFKYYVMRKKGIER